jgi:hypothetical protein
MPKTNLKVFAGQGKSKVEDDIDALFRLPLSEFISARKALAVKLKKEGRGAEAEQVKSLVKPSISAWTVNQLYWQQRALFDQLIATGQRLRQAQTRGRTGKVGDLRAAFEERREVLSQLSDMATALMRDAGHNPALDTLRRIATTLEAMSAYDSLPDGVSAGRLTQDIDPPGFDSLAAFATAPATTKPTKEPARVSAGKKSPVANAKASQKTNAEAEKNRLKKAHQEKLAAAKLSLQEAKRSLAAARARAKSLEAAQKKADAETKDAEKHRREAERRFKEANAVSEAATRRSQNMAGEVAQMKKTLQAATRNVETASQELESMFRESQ